MVLIAVKTVAAQPRAGEAAPCGAGYENSCWQSTTYATRFKSRFQLSLRWRRAKLAAGAIHRVHCGSRLSRCLHLGR